MKQNKKYINELLYVYIYNIVYAVIRKVNKEYVTKSNIGTENDCQLEFQGWQELQLFEEAEKFFMSVGLYEMFPNFWNNSMLVKPDDGRGVVCHPTAWDMGNREDFRYERYTDAHIFTHEYMCRQNKYLLNHLIIFM